MRCPKCGYTTEYEFESCPMCVTQMDSGKSINLASSEKGGFWVRLVAFIVDNVIIFFATAFFAFIAGLATGLGGLTSDVSAENVEYLSTIFGFFIGTMLGPFYYTLFTGWEGQTPRQETPGSSRNNDDWRACRLWPGTFKIHRIFCFLLSSWTRICYDSI